MNIESAYRLIFEKLENWLTGGIKMLPNFLVALIVVLLFVFLARLTRNMVHRTFKRIKVNQTLFRMVAAGVHFLTLLCGIFIALHVLNLTTAVTSLLAGAGIIGLALSFAFQGIATNLMAGLILSLKKPVHIGDIIEVQDYEGTIRAADYPFTYFPGA